MKQTSLSPGIRVDAQSAIVLPINVQAPRNLHDGGRSVRLAFIAAGLILRRIPGSRDFSAFGVERNKLIIVFVRHEHAIAPQFGDHGYPIAGQVLRRSLSRRFRRREWSVTPVPSAE